MRLYVAVTDDDWFQLHASRSNVDEVNFWRPSTETSFKALQPGELLLFKLHAPDNYIAGGGFFTRFLHLPLNLAWEAFGEANGVHSLDELRAVVARYRRTTIQPHENPTFGCIMLAEPFFWRRSDWIPAPFDFPLNIPAKGYDSESPSGKALWDAVVERLTRGPIERLEQGTAAASAIASGGYGKPQLVYPRLGQGLFRILVTEAYCWRCAITGERTLPVLQAAHIKPYRVVKRHEVSNGLLLRSDLHTLFDEGYLTVDPQDRRIIVSKRIREEFENGKDYYRLEGTLLREAAELWARPAAENLEYHAYVVFR